jgi:predicted nucleic acid-binding protein
MSNQRPVYCWDTCVLIAHLKGEVDKPLDDMLVIAKDVDTDNADMLLSITTSAEFDDIVDDPVLSDEYDRFLGRPNVQLIDVNPPVAKKVRVVRNRGINATPKRSIKIGDAQVIATALLYGADVLHTFDEPLLRLSRSSIVDGLLITKPQLLSGQKLLGFSVRTAFASCPSHFQEDGRATSFGRHLSQIERAVLTRTLAMSHR